MAEQLMVLVLKVQGEPKKLDKSKGPPMLDIGVLLFLGSFDVKKVCHPMISEPDGKRWGRSKIGWQRWQV